MREIDAGLAYREFTYHDSLVHLVRVDLTQRQLRPVMGADHFPILRVYPVITAVQEGALAAVGGGFNTVWAHGFGYADQPLHALVVDREIWTTGCGAGGFGVLIGENGITIAQNRIRIVVWRPDGTSFEVVRVNRSHGMGVSAFTARGGTNQRPEGGRHHVVLGEPGWWTPADHGEAQRRTMIVMQVAPADMERPPPAAEGTSVVFEAPWGMKLHEGDEVTWSQRLGGRNTRTVVSGWPQIVRRGVNIVPELEMDPEAPDGPDGWFVRENPRMVIGCSKDGATAYICVVQGRIEGSDGLRLKELATFLLQNGVYDAVNFDGGGSAFLWTKDAGLVADGTYGDGTLQGLRPDHYSMAVF